MSSNVSISVDATCGNTLENSFDTRGSMEMPTAIDGRYNRQDYERDP